MDPRPMKLLGAEHNHRSDILVIIENVVPPGNGYLYEKSALRPAPDALCILRLAPCSELTMKLQRSDGFKITQMNKSIDCQREETA